MAFVDQVASPTASSAFARPGRQAVGQSPQPDPLPNYVSLIAHHRRSALLNKVVEAEILPRLALARTGGKAAAASSETSRTAIEDDTAELVHRLMGAEEDGAQAFIEVLEQRGATPASLYLGVVTLAARRLGEMWEDDRCDFTQVTISLGRLQRCVRALSPSFQAAAVSRSAHADTILLLPGPGDQHTFGLVILGEFFQREGWHVMGGPVSTGYDAPRMVRDSWVDVAGFSVGSIKHVDALSACIHAVRKASRNRDLAVMVGGPLFLQRPELVARVGADTTAADAPSAVRQAKSLLAMREAAD